MNTQTLRFICYFFTGLMVTTSAIAFQAADAPEHQIHLEQRETIAAAQAEMREAREKMQAAQRRYREAMALASEAAGSVPFPPAPEAPDAPFAPFYDPERVVIGVIIGDQTENGVEIIGVTPQSSAAKAGLRSGDVLTGFSGLNLDIDNGRQALIETITELKKNDEVEISFLRNNEPRESVLIAENHAKAPWLGDLDLEMQARIREEILEAKELAERAKRTSRVQWDAIRQRGHFGNLGAFADKNEIFVHPQLLMGHAWSGLEMISLKKDLANYFGVKKGVLVTAAENLESVGLRAGDVITAVDSRNVSSPVDVMRRLGAFLPEDSFTITIVRDKRERTLNAIAPGEDQPGIYN